MCGICGIVYSDRERVPDAGQLDAMRDMLSHRGPDQQGAYLAPGVGLGHRRLRIIDLASGKQPLGNEDGSIQVAFNGEIYNFKELRQGLQAKGHVFATRTDTEVIVHLYEEVGGDFARHLDGMFAIALWDGRDGSLWLARDRLGKKPLFYYHDGEKLVFASELKSFLKAPGVDLALDESAVVDYLHFGYVVAPRSIFRGVKKLPPGHVVRWRGALGEPRAYWQLPRQSPKPWRWGDACAAFAEAFQRAVACRLESDVPLGAFLSGGLDSSAVVAAMCKASSGRVRTFTIGFHEQAHDESADARRVAEHLGTEHLELRAELKTTDLLSDLVWYMDEPMADSSALPTYLVSHLARAHVTVALSGDGGDELLGGYTRYFPDRRDRAFLRLPARVRRGMARVAPFLPRWAPGKRYYNYISKGSLDRYFFRLGIATPDAVAAVAGPALLDAARFHDPLNHLRALDGHHPDRETVRRFSHLDYGLYLPDDILVKVDRMSMASALEVRSPLLDHRLVELVATFPEEFRSVPGETKRVLRAFAAPLLPADSLRKPKHGFSMPVGPWLRNGLFRSLSDVLLDPRSIGRGLFREAGVRALLAEHQAGRGYHGPLLWALLCLEVWHRKFLDEGRRR